MTEGKCPSCGAPVQFRAGSSRIVLCEHCHTVVARGDVGLTPQGKVASLVDTDSPLSVGLGGNYRGSGFRVLGRVQKDHGAGVWDEWYLLFDDGREGWLSESEGRWNLMFPATAASEVQLSQLEPNYRLDLGNNRQFAVEELGHARTVSFEGELPGDVEPEADHAYADLTGQRGLFATLDFGRRDDAPEVFIGSEVAFAELGFDRDSLRPRVNRIQLQQARCTQCNGPLELKAPDATKRVACPFCGALLDVTGGKLQFLEQLEKPKRLPTIPLGRVGKWAGAEWTCIAFLVRSCEVEGNSYDWDEYLLYNREQGFRWLMESTGHWTFLTPIAAGDVTRSRWGGSMVYEGRSYKLFQKVTATTDFVLGECYWQVRQGERAEAREYVHPPYSLNEDGNDREVTWTHSEYVTRKQVADAFGVELQDFRSGIAPSQPNPHATKAREGLAWAAIYAFAIFILYFVFSAMSSQQILWEGAVQIPPLATSQSPESITFSEPFEVPKSSQVAVSMAANPLNNSWAGLEVDLVNEATGEVISTYGEMEYYSGVDSDGSWSEGSHTTEKFLSDVDKGRYVLRFVPSFPGPPAGTPAEAAMRLPSYSVRLETDAPHFSTVFFCWLLLFAVPVTRAILSSNFETRRWQDSNLS